MSNSLKTSVQITIDGSAISISAPFSASNNAEFKSRGGRFLEGAWVLPKSPASLKMIDDLFGSDSEVVTVEVNPSSTDVNCADGALEIGGYVLANRKTRDYAVRTPEGVQIFEGGWMPYGGSVKNPRVTWEEGTLLHVNVRKSFAKRYGLKIISTPEPEQPDDAELVAQMIEILQDRDLIAADKVVAIYKLIDP